jgi:hypothetical protein
VGQHDDPEASKPRADTQIKATIEWRQRRVETFQSLEGRRVNEHAGFANSQHIAHSVVLGLVKLPLGHRDALAKAGHRLTHLANHQGAVCDALLRASNTHKRRPLNAEREMLQCRAARCCVIAEQPQPGLFGDCPSRVEKGGSVRYCLSPRRAKGHNNILEGCAANHGVNLCPQGGISGKIDHADSICRPGLAE